MTLPRLVRALKSFMPAGSRWSLLTEQDLSLLYHTPYFPLDRYHSVRVLGELLPYLEILSGDILLAKGQPLLSHPGEAALIMIFPKSVAGQNLFFVEHLTLDFFPSQDEASLPPVYLSRNFADEGDLLEELKGLIPEEKFAELSRSFHHLLWTQLKILQLFSDSVFKKIKNANIQKFFKDYRDFAEPFFSKLAVYEVAHTRSWSADNKISLHLKNKDNVLHFDFSGSTWPKEWGAVSDWIEHLIPEVLRQNLYPELPASHAENSFFSLSVPAVSNDASLTAPSLIPNVAVPVLCDFMSEALGNLLPETQTASSAMGPLYIELNFGGGEKFQHLLFGGSGASGYSQGEFSSNPWLPGIDSLSQQLSLSPLPLETHYLGRRPQKQGRTYTIRGGEGVEWSFVLKKPAEVYIYTFQGIWPPLAPPHCGAQKAQVLVSKDDSSAIDILGKRIQVAKSLPANSSLTVRTCSGADLPPHQGTDLNSPDF